MLKNFWYACEFSHTITNQPKQIELWKQKIVLYRDSSGKLVALRDICPHRGTALSLGNVEKDCLRCPYHGWKFRADGTCIEIPANPSDTVISDRARVDNYLIQEKYGFIWLFWGDIPHEECPPLPTLPNFPDSSWQPVYVELKINAHYSRLLENLVDPVHTAFVHANSFGSGMSQEPQSLTQGKLVSEDWGASFFLIAKQPTPKKGLYWKYIHNKQQQEVKIKLAFCLPSTLR